MIKRALGLAEVRQNANLKIKGPRLAQIQNFIGESIGQLDDVLKPQVVEESVGGDEDQSKGAVEDQRADCRRLHAAAGERKLGGGPHHYPRSSCGSFGGHSTAGFAKHQLSNRRSLDKLWRLSHSPNAHCADHRFTQDPCQGDEANGLEGYC